MQYYRYTLGVGSGPSTVVCTDFVWGSRYAANNEVHEPVRLSAATVQLGGRRAITAAVSVAGATVGPNAGVLKFDG